MLIKLVFAIDQHTLISTMKNPPVVRTRILVFLIFVGLFSLSYFIGSETEVSEEDAVAFMEEFEELVEDIDGIGIFVHNVTISLPMFIPGFGPAWGFFSSWQTGVAFSALSVVNPILQDIPALAVLYASPFGIMELTAYSIAMSRAYLLTYKLIKKQNIKTDLKPVIIEIGIVVGLLLAGGFLEAYMIELVEESGFELFST